MRRGVIISGCILLLTGCKTTEYRTSESRVIDSLILKTEKVITAPILSSLTLNEICDTLTGKPKEFDYRIITRWGDTTRVWNQNNQLRIELNQQGDTIKDLRDELKIRETLIKEKEKKVIYRTNWKWTLLALVIGFVIGGLRPWRFI